MGSVALKTLPGQLWLLDWQPRRGGRRQPIVSRRGAPKTGCAPKKTADWVPFALADRAEGLEAEVIAHSVRVAIFDPAADVRICAGYAFLRGLDARRLEALRACPLLEGGLLGTWGAGRLSEVDLARLEPPRHRRGAAIVVSSGPWRGLRGVVMTGNSTRVQVELALRSGRRIVWLTPAQVSVDNSN